MFGKRYGRQAPDVSRRRGVNQTVFIAEHFRYFGIGRYHLTYDRMSVESFYGPHVQSVPDAHQQVRRVVH